MSSFHTRAEDLNSCCHACTANALLTEPSPLDLITEACLVCVVHQEELWPAAIFVVLPGCSVGLNGLETHLCSAHPGSAHPGFAHPGSAHPGSLTWGNHQHLFFCVSPQLALLACSVTGSHRFHICLLTCPTRP